MRISVTMFFQTVGFTGTNPGTKYGCSWCSIGSLGDSANEPGVQNITVRSVVFTGTQNGFRIKTWGKPSTGFVKGVSFQNAVMNNVQNPIIVDQNYCPGNINCPNQVKERW